MTFNRRKLGPLLVMGAGVALWLVLGRKTPVDQVVHIVLGDASPRVTEVRLRYEAGEPKGDGEALREATFHYAAGQAPRIVTHEPRLASGTYTLDIERIEGNDRARVRREVKLDGDPVSVEFREPLP